MWPEKHVEDRGLSDVENDKEEIIKYALVLECGFPRLSPRL